MYWALTDWFILEILNFSLVFPVTVAKQMPQNPLITISALAQNWKTLSRPYPTLVVRVLNRSRLHCFAKCDKLQKWPFQVSSSINSFTNHPFWHQSVHAAIHCLCWPFIRPCVSLLSICSSMFSILTLILPTIHPSVLPNQPVINKQHNTLYFLSYLDE